MNKNYKEWGSTGSDSAFQNKLDQLRDLRDLELLTSRYSRSLIAAEKPPELSSQKTAQSQEVSTLPIDKESMLYNRSHFDHTLDYEIERALRYHRFLSICIVGIDNLDDFRTRLKEQDINQLVLRLGRAFKDSLRGIDIPARFNANSFAVLLPETNAQGATVVAERVRTVFKSSALHTGRGEFDVCPCLGCACFPSHAKTAQGLIESALKSLETASKRGGNMVCML